MLIINAGNFEVEVIKSEQPVVDLWGSRCEPYLLLMPDLETLAKEFEVRLP